MTGGTTGMMTQEEYVNEVLALRRQGWTLAEIAAEMEGAFCFLDHT
jgi:transcriptional regulator